MEMAGADQSEFGQASVRSEAAWQPEPWVFPERLLPPAEPAKVSPVAAEAAVPVPAAEEEWLAPPACSGLAIDRQWAA
jgi:hypothetical protein